jgi:hypothetical protein
VSDLFDGIDWFALGQIIEKSKQRKPDCTLCRRELVQELDAYWEKENPWLSLLCAKCRREQGK